jgi:hypothetical protein
MRDITDILIHYIAKPISHPSEVAWLVEASNGAYGLYSWIQDLKLMADMATKHP